MHTIGMDTYLLIADGVAAAEGEVEGRIRPFRWWIRGKTAAGAENPAPLGQANDARNGRLRTGVRCAIIRSPTLDTKPLAERDAALLGGSDRVAGSGLPAIRNGY